MKRILSTAPAVLLTTLAAALLLYTGTGAVTNAAPGLSVDTTRTQLDPDAVGYSGGTVTQTLSAAGGDIRLTATGTSTKSLVLSGVGCGNAHMAWDDSLPGAAYKATYRSTWNAPGDCNGQVNGTVPELEMWGPGGQYSSYSSLTDGETQSTGVDVSGSGTTKFEWGNVDADWATVNLWYCGHLIPGGGGLWDDGSCV